MAAPAGAPADPPAPADAHTNTHVLVASRGVASINGQRAAKTRWALRGPLRTRAAGSSASRAGLRARGTSSPGRVPRSHTHIATPVKRGRGGHHPAAAKERRTRPHAQIPHKPRYPVAPAIKLLAAFSLFSSFYFPIHYRRCFLFFHAFTTERAPLFFSWRMQTHLNIFVPLSLVAISATRDSRSVGMNGFVLVFRRSIELDFDSNLPVVARAGTVAARLSEQQRERGRYRGRPFARGSPANALLRHRRPSIVLPHDRTAGLMRSW